MYQQFPKGGVEYYLPILNGYLDWLLDLLAERGFQATFLTLGVMARQYPEVIHRIASRGHEIGCHSDKHHLISSLDRKAFAKDTEQALSDLEACCGKKVKYYRAPAFSIGRESLFALEVLQEQGIEVDSSIFPARRRRGGFAGFKIGMPCWIKLPNGQRIKELPINYVNFMFGRIMYSGGGYFRLLPLPLLKFLFSRSSYNMGYFHLRDFDAKQKKVISMRYLISYFGIQGAQSKFERMLESFDFMSIGQAVGKIEWEYAPSVAFGKTNA